MKLHRYTFPDPYVLVELRGRYESAGANGRVQLLSELSTNEDWYLLPYEIAVLAVGDTNVEVRRWIARHGRYLDYEKDGSKDQAANAVERNLWMRLKADPDPLVRAQLRENPDILRLRIGESIKWFRESSHLERLALVRNEHIDEELIEQVFDPEETELGLTLIERYELCCAFLTNRTVIDKNAKDAGLVGDIRELWDGWAGYSAQKFLRALWLNAAKWPKGTGDLQDVVYRYVPVDDETKAKVYEACDKAAWRNAILENCDAKRDRTTFALALRDRDDYIREQAHGRIPHIDDKSLSVLLVGDDKRALRGLADNRELPEAQQPEVHRRVRARLHELGESTDAFDDFDLMHHAHRRASRRAEASTARGRRRRLARRLRAIQRRVDTIQFLLNRLFSVWSLVLFACGVGLAAAVFTRWLR